MNKGKLLQTAKLFLGWPLSILALYFLWQLFVHQKQALLNFHAINISFIIISLLFFVNYFILRSYIWQKLLEYNNYTIPFKESMFLWAASELKRYVPGNIWSFLGRMHLFNKKNVPNKIIIRSLITEMQLIVLSGVIVSLLSLPIIFHITHLQESHKLITGLVVVVTSLLTLFFIFSASSNKFLQLELTSKISGLVLDFKPSQKIYLLFLYIIAFLMFGTATYFAILSITNLWLPSFLVLCGYFVFSLIVGYVSVITPTGLGVREGAMTAGLWTFMPLTIASFASLFSRIVLLIGELLFLLIAYLLYKVKNNNFNLLLNGFAKHIHSTILMVLISGYSIYFTSATIVRYNNFYSGRFDLGNMDQAVWNTLHGRIFQVTDPNGTNIISRLAFHADFLLIILSPFYLLWSDPRMLLIIQSVTLGFGALFIYLLSQHIIKNKNISITLASIYLIYPAINYVNLYDFHPVALATTFLLGAYYFMLKKRYIWLSVFLLLACLSKEEVWVIAGLFGVYLVLKEKLYLFGGILSGACISIFYYLVVYLIPHVRGSEHFALSYYSDFGTKPTAIVKSIVFSPFKTFALATGHAQIHYLIQLFLPLGYLSIAAPFVLFFAAPDLIAGLLSNNSQLHQIYYQYSAPITPFVFISAIYGIWYIQKRWKKISPLIIICYLVFVSLYSAWMYGPLPGTKNPNVDMFTKPLHNSAVINDFVSGIPASYSIAATNNLGSHLSRRRKIFTIPIGIDKADVILFLLNDPFAQPSLKAQKKIVEAMKHDSKYVEVFELNDFIVFKKTNINLRRLPQNKFRNFLPLLRRPRVIITSSPTR